MYDLSFLCHSPIQVTEVSIRRLIAYFDILSLILFYIFLDAIARSQVLMNRFSDDLEHLSNTLTVLQRLFVLFLLVDIDIHFFLHLTFVRFFI